MKALVPTVDQQLYQALVPTVVQKIELLVDDILIFGSLGTWNGTKAKYQGDQQLK